MNTSPSVAWNSIHCKQLTKTGDDFVLLFNLNKWSLCWFIFSLSIQPIRTSAIGRLFPRQCAISMTSALDWGRCCLGNDQEAFHLGNGLLLRHGNRHLPHILAFYRGNDEHWRWTQKLTSWMQLKRIFGHELVIAFALDALTTKLIEFREVHSHRPLAFHMRSSQGQKQSRKMISERRWVSGHHWSTHCFKRNTAIN